MEVEEEWATPPSTPPLARRPQESQQQDQQQQERPPLAHKLSVPRGHVFEMCADLAEENMRYFQTSRFGYSDRFVKSCQLIQKLMDEVVLYVTRLQSIAYLFDLDEKTPGNGYRSIVCVTDTCILHLIRLLRSISSSRTSLVFRSAYFCKELEAHTSVLYFMTNGLGEVVSYLDVWPKGYLFPLQEQSETMRALLDTVDRMDPSCFYGRAIGFQFCATVCRIFQVIGVALAAYSVSWQKGGGTLSSLSSIMQSGRLLLSPELRAKRIAEVITHADIGLCKGFWNLSDGAVLTQVPNWLCPQLTVNEIVFIPADESLFVDKVDGSKVEIVPPSSHTGKRPITARFMAFTPRKGMKFARRGSRSLLSRPGMEPSLEASPYLLFHCHGGGFVATSSRAHETYLRHWAKLLNCPMLSIDYSLAPENPFPRPLEEVLYAYAWALNNAESLGWSGERVCFAGDSAGGNLVTTTTLKAIEMGFKRLPDGLVLIYSPFLFQFDPSPSRLLSLMDPLLPMGILVRCLGAYAGCYGATKSQIMESVQSDKSPTSHKSIQEYFKEIQNGKLEPPNLEGNQDILSLVNLDPPPSVSKESDTSELKPSPSASILSKKTPSSDTGQRNRTSSKRVVFHIDASEDQDETSEERKPAKSETETALKRKMKKSKSLGAFMADEAMEQSETEGKMSDNRSHAPGLIRNPSTETGDSEEGATIVEIHRDPTRIWLCSSIYDHDFVDYLSQHDKIKDSLVLLDSSGERLPVKTNENGKIPLQAMASVGQRQREEGGEDKEASSTTLGHSLSRSKSTGSLRRSWSMTFTDTMALATGHVFDNLSGLVEHSSAEEEKENPLATLRKMHVPKNPFLSPMYAPDEWMKKLPSVHLVACHLDPLLDDSVEFARKIRKLGGKADIDILDSLPHGFLNFTLMSPECRAASRLCLTRVRAILGMEEE